eukprot:sb/3472226/
MEDQTLHIHKRTNTTNKRSLNLSFPPYSLVTHIIDNTVHTHNHTHTKSNQIHTTPTKLSNIILSCTLSNTAQKASKQPIRTRYLGHVTGYQPIRDQYCPDSVEVPSSLIIILVTPLGVGEPKEFVICISNTDTQFLGRHHERVGHILVGPSRWTGRMGALLYQPVYSGG